MNEKWLPSNCKFKFIRLDNYDNAFAIKLAPFALNPVSFRFNSNFWRDLSWNISSKKSLIPRSPRKFEEKFKFND